MRNRSRVYDYIVIIQKREIVVVPRLTEKLKQSFFLSFFSMDIETNSLLFLSVQIDILINFRSSLIEKMGYLIRDIILSRIVSQRKPRRFSAR